MERIRKGNDVIVYLSVFSQDGEVMLPADSKLEVWGNDSSYNKIKFSDLTISGNIAQFTIKGNAQTVLGMYRGIISWITTDGAYGEADSILFEIVQYSCQQGGSNGCPEVRIETVRVSTSSCTGKKGDKGDPGKDAEVLNKPYILASSGWVKGERYYEQTITDADIAEGATGTLVVITLANETWGIAREAEIQPMPRAEVGSITLYAAYLPTGDINITYSIVK